MNVSLDVLSHGIPYEPLPENKGPNQQYPHAQIHNHGLTNFDKQLAVKNALRYFPKYLHGLLNSEFELELEKYGHIYMYRFKPPREILKAYHISLYPAKIPEAASIMLMISNNLDPDIAQYPDELVTYGGNGQVFSNWAQYWTVMKFLSKMNNDQCLVMYSGHPLGLFPTNSLFRSPKMVITNGMVIPNYSSPTDYEKLFALGVTQYGQMTAGSYCYIGPQGIVHGTTLTLINAIRNQTKIHKKNEVDGKIKVFVTSGLGGMSGAQPKASVIANCIGVIAEVSKAALNKRFKQGWVEQICNSITEVIAKIKEHIQLNQSTSIGFLGNVVDLWEALVEHHKLTGELLVDIGSDQTSCHILLEGGYYPAGLSYEESRALMNEDKDKFKSMVYQSLQRQIQAINYLSTKGMYFFDYGNAFLLQAGRAGADVFIKNSIQESSTVKNKFKYPSYVQDIMGQIFSMGFGPFRWVCTSCDDNDLVKTDEIAAKEIEKILNDKYFENCESDCYKTNVKQQYEDNLNWIKNAGKYELVVGSKARILYTDVEGRVNIAKAFNDAVSQKIISAPIILSRDHHDVSGTDSPYRETSNIYDGSAVCADMAIQNVIGDAFRGASWVAIHNGGGTGWGEAINGGFGLLLDGSKETEERALSMLEWDVINGLSRRMWSGNETARSTMEKWDLKCKNLELFYPN